jgi:hypothetical protein
MGHGAMFARDGTELKPTILFVAKTQAFYRDQLLRRASTKQRGRLAALREQVTSGLRLDKRSRVVVGVLLLDWLIRQKVAPPSDTLRLLGINYLLRDAVRANDVSKPLRVRLKQAGLLRPRPPILPVPRVRATSSRGLVSPASGAAYRTLCAQSGVPIPPDWGTSQWVDRGALTSPFISGNLNARVFTYHSTSPEGLVIALPRVMPNTTTIKLLGIISLGKASGKVCFWDNQTGNPSNPQFLVQVGQVVPIDQFGGGGTLDPFGPGGRCSSCHAGENPYVIHPATVLGQLKAQGLPTFADRFYEPILPTGFPQNSIPNPPSTGPCSGCHTIGGIGGRFPELSTALSEYCTTILNQAIQRTMPPGNPGGLATDPQVLALQQQCGQAPRPRQDLALVTSVTPTPTATVATGSQFTETVKFSNGGTTAWTGSHTLFFLPPPAGGPVVWGATPSANLSIGTPTQPIFPPDEVTRTITVIAPTQPGTYDFAFAVHDPAGNVIGQSLLTQITVENPSASLSLISAPNSLSNGQSDTVTVVATNDGHTTWTPGDHFVQLLRINRISLPQATVAIPAAGVPPGATFTFMFTIICNGSGTGGFSARMVGPTGPFGQLVGKTVICQ